MIQRIPPSLAGTNVALVVRSCAVCEQEYEAPKRHPKAYTTCSDECTAARRRRAGWTVVVCRECGRDFRQPKKGTRVGQFCSNPCRLAALNRIPRPYKGKGVGTIDKRGHRVVTVWGNDGTARHVMEHRLVMEQLLDRTLAPSEVVHHINLDPSDNRPLNLWLCANQGEHVLIHALTERFRANGWLTADVLSTRPAQGRKNAHAGNPVPGLTPEPSHGTA